MDAWRRWRFTPVEIAPAVALAVLGLWGLWSHPAHLAGSRALLTLALTAMPLSLVYRRRRPVTVLLVAVACVVVPTALGSYVQSGAIVLVLVVAVFSCGRYADRPAAYLAVPVGAATVLVGAAADPVETIASTWLWSLNVVWIFALGAWMRQAHALVVRTRAEGLANARAAAAEERLRVARDLHDVLAHSLSVMVVQSEVADALLPDDVDRARVAVQRVQEIGREALAETRQVLDVLRADGAAIDGPVLDVEQLVARFRTAGLPVTLDLRTTTEVTPRLREVLYRVVQESLTNALRHAGPRPTRVTVHVDDARRLVVDVENEGERVRTDGEPAGYGLRGMRERVEGCGGSLVVGPRRPGGFAVHAELPLAPAEPA